MRCFADLGPRNRRCPSDNGPRISSAPRRYRGALRSIRGTPGDDEAGVIARSQGVARTCAVMAGSATKRSSFFMTLDCFAYACNDASRHSGMRREARRPGIQGAAKQRRNGFRARIFDAPRNAGNRTARARNDQVTPQPSSRCRAGASSQFYSARRDRLLPTQPAYPDRRRAPSLSGPHAQAAPTPRPARRCLR